MVQFIVSPKFEIPVKVGPWGRKVDFGSLKNFWGECGDIANKRGCYVFSLKVAKGELPFYVGKAAAQCFEKECFADHKLSRHYDEVLASRKGKPFMWFVTPETKRGKTPKVAIAELEEFLIAQASRRNPDLTNRTLLPTQWWHIKGVRGSGKGKPNAAEQAFRKLIGVR